MADPIFDKEGNISNLDELTSQEVATAYSEKNKSLFGRLTDEEAKRKQAEADKVKLAEDLEAEKKKNAKPPEEKIPPPPGNTLSEEELRLIARGLFDEEIDEAKVIAKGKGITLTEALKTPLFELFQNDLKEKKKKEDAHLGASHGSGQQLTEKPVTSGMTRDEHKAAFDEARGKLT